MIAPIGAAPIAAATAATEKVASTSTGGDFAQALTEAIGQARGDERRAMAAADGFAVGDPAVGIHEVVIASEKSNISLRYATTLKNKLLEAYRELMNTPV